MTAKVELRGISHRFENLDALQSINLTVEAGEFAVLLGPSGCGKTTLLMILAGFLTPTAGQVFIDDKDVTHIPPMNRPTTTMFQDYALFPHMSIAHNVEFGLRMKGVAKSARREKAMALLDMVGLQESSGKRPFELSGGQRQRVALARALAIEPDVLLLDEPLGALDLKLRRQMQDELKSIQQRVGTTFVHVTHDQEEAMAIADKIVLMNQGQIEDCGSANDVYMRPVSSFSAGFMGEVNLLQGTVSSTKANCIVVDTTLGQWYLADTAMRSGVPVSGNVNICVRPEHFRTENDDNRLNIGQARIVDIAFFGTHQRCHLQPLADPALTLVAHLPQSVSHKPGDLIDIVVATEFITIIAR